MRINLKVTLCLVIVGAFFTTISYWTKCGNVPVAHTSFSLLSRLTQPRSFLGKYSLQDFPRDEAYEDDVSPNGSHPPLASASATVDSTSEIDCVINGEYTVSCRREDHEVYVPFTFLHKYFEVYGKVTADGGVDRFEWQHSYSKYYVPKGKYDARGGFMNFDNFNVEARDRVKCISAMEGVPVSTQWDVRGYLYPIQIAQFALSHFSKNRTEPKARVSVYEDGRDHKSRWSTPSGSIRREWDGDLFSDVMSFKTTESLLDPGISLPLDQSTDFVLQVNLKMQSNGSLSVIVEDSDHHEHHYIHYVCSQVYISAEGNHIFYGMGSRRRWTLLTRDVLVDLRKGVSLAKASSRKSKSHNKFRLLGVVLRGQGSIDNLTLSSSAHMTHFLDGSEWLLRHQDEKGGWPVPVERKFSSVGMGNLAPGWYSAMAQGQAMSVLTRAYHATADARYLEAALRAIGPFQVSSEDNGIVARFLDRYEWYEEYPTVPSSFVLNGFVYSLIGLYDLKEALDEEDSRGRKVTLLFEEGMRSLRTLLPFFDSGVSSFYDLRHFTLGIAPNLARWDYHTTHIGQLLLLATIDDAQILRTTAERWIEYTKGKRSPHN